jgi:hypothetical protein
MIATLSSKPRRAIPRGAAVPLLVSLLLTPMAHAQTDATQRENAQALYKAGNDARDAGDMKTAANNYRIAYALVQTPVIAVALGKAQAALGQLIEGRQTLLGVVKIPLKPSESVLTTTARAEAATLAAQIEPRIPSVTLRIVTPEGAPAPNVAIDGVTIPDVGLNAPWKVDPGAHMVVATVQDAKTETRFSVAETESREVVLDYPALSSVAVPTPVVEPPKTEIAPPAVVPIPMSRGHRPSQVPAYVALGVGGAGVVVTAVFGVLAVHDKSALNTACGLVKTDCPLSAQSDINALHSSSLASDVGLGVAVAGLAVGGALLIFRRGSSGTRPNSDNPTAVRIEPWASARALGMTGSFP